jgi:hypothetical protein
MTVDLFLSLLPYLCMIGSLLLSLYSVLRPATTPTGAPDGHRNKTAGYNSSARSLNDKIAVLSAELRDIRNTAATALPPRASVSDLHLTPRAHILRLHRSGQSAAQIATALGAPRQEVDLAIKLHAALARHDRRSTPAPTDSHWFSSESPVGEQPEPVLE